MNKFAKFMGAACLLFSCGTYDDLPPAEQLAAIDEEIASLNESLGSAPAGGWSAELAGAAALTDGLTQVRIDTLRTKRAEVLRANPALAPTAAASGSSGPVPAGAVPVGSVRIGQNVSGLSLTQRCGMPAGSANEQTRRAWYNETSKINSIGPFQTNVDAQREISSTPIPSGYGSRCEATAAQLYAILPSANQAIASSNRLNNGSGIGLVCGTGGASVSAACTAVQTVYAMKVVSYMCHYTCGKGI